MKNLLIVLSLLFVGSISNDETITWNEDAKLTWEDFKATPDKESDAVALTASGITFGYSVSTSGDRIVDFNTTVETHFYPNKSWYFKEKSDVHILKHEQLHFDITELYARKFKKRIAMLRVNKNIKKQLGRLHQTINKDLAERQMQYDRETEHSIDAVKQREWENFIEKELKALDAFKAL